MFFSTFLKTFAAASVLIITSSAYSADLRIVEHWLRTNSDTRTLKVDFVQSRDLKTIKKPLVQSGALWLDYSSDQFRWQLGNPVRTIVVSQGERVAVMRTPLKRIEYREGGGSSGNAPGLSGLSRGFPKTLAQFQERYRILDIVTRETSYEIVTQPLGSDGEGISRFGFVIDRNRFLLKGLVIQLKDGSMITTSFQRVERNQPIGQDVFRPDVSGYQETTFKQG